MPNKLSFRIAEGIASDLGEWFYGAGLDEGIDLDEFVDTVKLSAEIFYNNNIADWNEMEAERIDAERQDTERMEDAE